MKLFSCLALCIIGLAVADCPDSPNCVSSNATNASQKIAPFSYAGHPKGAALEALRKAIAATPRTSIESDDGTTIHATARSFLFGFIDDLHFTMEDEQQIVQVRSASRKGYWDLGVNRRRVEAIRSLFKSNLIHNK